MCENKLAKRDLQKETCKKRPAKRDLHKIHHEAHDKHTCEKTSIYVAERDQQKEIYICCEKRPTKMKRDQQKDIHICCEKRPTTRDLH